MRRRVLLPALGLLFLAAAPSAMAHPYLFHMGIGYSEALNSGSPGGSIAVTGGVMFRPRRTPNLGVGAEIGYLGLGEARIYRYDPYMWRSGVSWSCVPMTAQFYVLPPRGRNLTPVLTGGLGVYSTHTSWAWARHPANGYYYPAGYSTTEFGFNFGWGLMFGRSMAPVRFGVDARFHEITTDPESIRVFALTGNLYF
jgi:hypothetical protein